MDGLKQMNLAMNYIEENLAGEIDLQQVARLACCSEYHFRRMFSFLSGLTLGEYIRLRRLTLAALELHNHNIKVIDLAVKYGYDSPDSFTRAFQGFHGLTPKEARRNGASLKAVPPMTFQLTIKGGNQMNYRIEEKGAFQIVGIKKRMTLIFEGVNPQMDSMWQSLTMEDIKELKTMSNIEPTGILCVSVNFEERVVEGTEFDQYIGVATTKPTPEHWSVMPVEASTWAVFTAVGEFPKALQDTWAKIYSEWFPTSGYELTGGPEILWNESKDTSLPNYKSEIWIPVVKK
ncbi:AraC family transcriptional regulator [Desulforamulus ruminis]|uniref:AraC family transcriptional regulator n=1 Tax=Desulforamulus ruminis TaxID=1564 RepID=UPI002FD9F0D2